ncbi:hypothetical protein [Anianabacter salinae]|uniref:hypothetical protein n=1 Tax=Anianabacter salinae TaxID=2851023 RepID=UPI00225E478D|nr:hypothetical protein [Anianabacter salinae]MBV0912850.1 hypothetical protein [Anianabacter salinae]
MSSARVEKESAVPPGFVSIAKEEAIEIQDAIEETLYLLSHAESVMGSLAELVPDNTDIGPFLALLERGFKNALDVEGRRLDAFVVTLREAIHHAP